MVFSGQSSHSGAWGGVCWGGRHLAGSGEERQDATLPGLPSLWGVAQSEGVATKGSTV